MARKSTAEALLNQWDRQLDLIYEDFRGLVIRRHVYKKVRTIIQRNPHLHKPSSFYDFMGATFAAFAVIAVRRQREAMKLLLSSIEKNPQILSRERFVEIFTTKILAGRKPTRPRGPSGGGAYIPSVAKFQIMASKTFDDYAGPDAAHVDPAHVYADLEDLWEKAKKLEKFADKKIAHLIDQPTELPTLPGARCLHLDL